MGNKAHPGIHEIHHLVLSQTPHQNSYSLLHSPQSSQAVREVFDVIDQEG